MTTILAYLWTPLVMAVLAIGTGLLVERVSRFPLPSALLGPVGAGAALALTTLIYRVHGNAIPAAIALALAAGAGLWLSRGELAARLRPGAGGAAALGAYLLFVGPSLLTGHWTWAGYNFVNDPSVNLLYVDLLAHHGYQELGDLSSTTTRMQTFGVGQRYPMGVHGLLATLGPFTGIDAAARYQPFIAALAGGAAAALAQIARRAGLPGGAAGLLGVLAAGANLTYQYGQHGAIKEIAVVLLVVAAAAVTAEAATAGLRAGFGAVLALCLTPIVLVLSAGGAPYAALGAVLAVLALVAGRRRPSPRLLAGAAVVGVVAVVIAGGAVVPDVLAYSRGAGSSFETPSGGAGSLSPATFGHLVRALPPYQAAGIWFGQDYRFGLSPGPTRTLQTALIAVIAVLAAVGVVTQLAGRRPGAPLLLLLCGLTAVLAAPRLEPYADAKLLVILAPAVVLAAGLGLWALWRARLPFARLAAVALALVCGGSVLYSDALAAHGTRLAPSDRMDALEDAADHAGGGYWLVNEWEEFAKYFAREARTSTASESESPDVVSLRKDEPLFGNYFDLDEQTLYYLDKFDGILMRRSPVASRPPSDFRLVYVNEYYELWRREGRSVREHLSLGSHYAPAARPRCAEVRALGRRAEREGGILVAAPRPAVPVLDPAQAAVRPDGWVPVLSRPGIVSLHTPGRLTSTIDVPAQARYRVWVQLTTGRPMKVSINHQPIGEVQQVNSPEQWLEAGEVQLPAGEQLVDLERRGGRLTPGDGYEGELGPVALERIGPEPDPVRVDPELAGRLCSGSYDWIESVRR